MMIYLWMACSPCHPHGIRQVCHVAAQYGQTAFLYHVALRWDADVDAPDADGRTPLHWAAYKGFGDTIRLLLVMDARWALADREGCTPLHWAAIRGNAEACTLLLQARNSNAAWRRPGFARANAHSLVTRGLQLQHLTSAFGTTDSWKRYLLSERS